MNTNNSRNKLVRDKGVKRSIALRISDENLYEDIEKLAKEQHISLNMAVNMLLGFAFNEVNKQNKTFVPKIVFESK